MTAYDASQNYVNGNLTDVRMELEQKTPIDAIAFAFEMMKYFSKEGESVHLNITLKKKHFLIVKIKI